MVDVTDAERFMTIMSFVPFPERVVPVSHVALELHDMIPARSGGLEMDAMLLAKQRIPPQDFALVVSTSHPEFVEQVFDFQFSLVL